MKYRKTERGPMKYPLELKTKVLKDYFDGVDGIRGLERTYGIQHQLILSWIKKCGNPQKSLRQSEETKETCLHLHEPPTFQDPRKELEYLRAENAYLREMLVLSGYHKNGRKKKRFAAIRALATRGYTVKLLCRIAEVSRSGYYRSVEANASPNRDLRLADTIQQIQQDVRYSYGAKRMAGYIAQHEGMPINHKRIARIMHEYLLNARVRTRRHPAYWYRQRHAQRLSDRQCAPNVLDREFTSDLPLKKLVTDVTWVNFAGGTLYLSALMDLFNHEIISYEISTQNTTATALAPILALVRAGNCDGVLLHCDRGPTYRSEAYQRLLTDNKVISSYSRAGNCWDNAPMECFWGHLKCELGYVDRSAKKRSFHSLAQEITDYMSFYNERRIQKHLGWLSPVQYRIQKCGEAGSTLVST